jgi:hypothetical protein
MIESFLGPWGARYRIDRRPISQRLLSERWRMIEPARSRTQARGEHAFRVVKQLLSFDKARYCGLAKNPARTQTNVCPGQPLLVRRQLLPAGAKSCAVRKQIASAPTITPPSFQEPTVMTNPANRSPTPTCAGLS